jgi:cyanophycinase
MTRPSLWERRASVHPRDPKPAMRMLPLLAAVLLGAEGDAPQGRLIVLGGGPTSVEIRTKMLELAGGLKAHILIVPQASPDPAAGEITAKLWRDIGAAEVNVLDLSDPDKAVASVEWADLIWMRGGNQVRLMDQLVKTPVPDAMRSKLRKGAIIAGTSAGAAVMSSLMIAGSAGPRGTPEGAVPRTAQGLGFWPDVIVDQHFLKRDRLERLKRAVHDHPDMVGIGIDELGAVMVSGREFEVITGSVVVLDARKPVCGKAKEAEGGDAPEDELSPVTVKQGMKFHLDKGILSSN